MFRCPSDCGVCDATSAPALETLCRTRRRPRRVPQRVETSKDAHVPREPLTLVAQPSQLSQLDLAQGRPTAEEQCHAFITIVSRIPKLVLVEPCEVLGKVRRHLDSHLSAAPGAGAVRRFGRAPAEVPQPLPDPGGQATRDLHEHLASTALGAMASEVTRKERLGRNHGSRSAFTPEVQRCSAPRGSRGHTSATRSTVSSWKTRTMRCSSSSAMRARPPTSFPTAFRRSTLSALFDRNWFGRVVPTLARRSRVALRRSPTTWSTSSRLVGPRQSASHLTRFTPTDLRG